MIHENQWRCRVTTNNTTDTVTVEIIFSIVLKRQWHIICNVHTRESIQHKYNNIQKNDKLKFNKQPNELWRIFIQFSIDLCFQC